MMYLQYIQTNYDRRRHVSLRRQIKQGDQARFVFTDNLSICHINVQVCANAVLIHRMYNLSGELIIFYLPKGSHGFSFTLP